MISIGNRWLDWDVLQGTYTPLGWHLVVHVGGLRDNVSLGIYFPSEWDLVVSVEGLSWIMCRLGLVSPSGDHGGI